METSLKSRHRFVFEILLLEVAVEANTGAELPFCIITAQGERSGQAIWMLSTFLALNCVQVSEDSKRV